MTAENRKIVLGTRGSELARAQARLVEKAIQTARPEAKIETKIIATRGDKAKVVDPRAGRKGVFTAEIERALLAGEVDVAVHSAKDLPSETSPEARIAAVLPRAPMDDVLVSKHRGGLASLPTRGHSRNRQRAKETSAAVETFGPRPYRSSRQRANAVAKTGGKPLGRDRVGSRGT